MIAFILRHPLSVGLAVLLHVGVVMMMTAQWHDKKEAVKVSIQGSDAQKVKQDAKPEQLKTFAVDASLVKEQVARLRAKEAARKLEQQLLLAQTDKERLRLKALQKQQRAEQAKADKAKQQTADQIRKTEAERKKADAERKIAIAERKKAEEAKRLARLAQQRAEAEREKAKQAKADALKADKARQQALEKTKLAEAALAVEEVKKAKLEKEIARKAKEKKALELAAKQAKADRERADAAAALQRELDAEAAEQRAAQKRQQMLSLRETYISSITAKVQDNWRTPARISEKAQCDLKITQTRKGSVSSVKILNCNSFATKQFKQAAEKAVYRSEPLPAPPVKELFERVITFTFKP